MTEGAQGGSLTISADWLGEMNPALELFDYGKLDGVRTNDQDGLSIELADGEACYLANAGPKQLRTRPELVFAPPAEPVNVSLHVDQAGLELALWIIEFAGDQHLASQRWRVTGGRINATWSPTPGTDGVRLALRVMGKGVIRSAKFSVGASQRATDEAATRSSADQVRDGWLTAWKALNRPKSEMDTTIESVMSASLTPQVRLAALNQIVLEVSRVPGEAAKTQLAGIGIDPRNLDFDTAPYGATISPSILSALKTGRYTSRCPFTGESVVSSDSFLVCHPSGRPYVFVRFECGDKVFFQIYDCYGGAKVGLYLPGSETVVSRLKIGEVIGWFQYLVLRSALQFVTYLLDPSPRTTCVPLETMSHLGHWFFNELEAISDLADKGLDARVDVWLRLEQSFLNSADLFPWMRQRHVEFAGSAEAAFNYCLNTRRMVVLPRLGNYFIGEEVTRQMRAVVAREASESRLDARISAKLQGKWPVLWVEIRVHDRTWINQVEAMPVVIEMLRRRYPNLAVVVGGWSRMITPRGDDEVMIRKEQDFIAQLAASAQADLHFVSGERATRKFAWARHCHAYLATHGTGLAFPLLYGIHGVTIANLVDIDRYAPMGGAPPEYVHGQRRLLFVPRDHVEDHDVGQHWQTRGFRIDPAGLAEFLDREVLSKLERPPDDKHATALVEQGELR